MRTRIVPKIKRQFLPNNLRNPLSLNFRLLRLREDIRKRRMQNFEKRIRVDSKTKKGYRRLLHQIDEALVSGKVKPKTRLSEIIRHKRKYERRTYSDKRMKICVKNFGAVPVNADTKDTINTMGFVGAELLKKKSFLKEIKDYTRGNEEYEVIDIVTD